MDDIANDYIFILEFKYKRLWIYASVDNKGWWKTENVYAVLI